MMTILYFLIAISIAVFLLYRGHRQCHESFHTNVGFREEPSFQRADREHRKKKRQQAYLMIGGGAMLLILALLALSQRVDMAYRETLYICIGGIIAGTIIFYPFRRLVSYYSKGFKLTDMRPAQTCGFIIMLLSGLAFFVILINQFVFRL